MESLFGHLPPYVGIVGLVAFVFAGRKFRDNWKHQEDGWQMRCWIYGLISALSFAAIALIPLQQG